MQVVMALDQGTTSSRAILFDHQGMIVGVAQREFEQIYPQPGWVEHDADEIWQSQLSVAREVLDKTNTSSHDVAALGIANQRETVVVWERATGTADCQCHRVAGPTYRCRMRPASKSRPRETDPIQNRTAAGCLFLRHQNPLAAG